jgi:hypothetical protein
MMKKRFLMLGLLFGVGVAHAEVYLPDGSMVDFDTAIPLVRGDTVILDGVRVNGSGLSSENDAVRLGFIFNPETLNFEFDNIDFYMGVGVYHEWHMAIDVPVATTEVNSKGKVIEMRQPFYTANKEAKTGKRGAEIIVPPVEPLKAGETYEFTSTGDTPFVANLDLSIGHVMSFFISGAKQDIKYQLISNTEVKEEGEIKARSSALLPPFKILTANCQLRIEPSNVEDSVTFKLKAFNANNRTMEVLEKNQKGTSLNLRFARGIWDYAKFQVTLEPGETLDIDKGAEENMAMKLVDRTSHLVAYVDGKRAFIYKNTEVEAKDYYLFIYDKVGAGKGYRGKVFILAEGEKKPKQPKPKPKPTPKPVVQPPETTDGLDAGSNTPPEVPEPLDAGPDTPAPEVPEPNVDENVDAPEPDPTIPEPEAV